MLFNCWFSNRSILHVYLIQQWLFGPIMEPINIPNGKGVIRIIKSNSRLHTGPTQTKPCVWKHCPNAPWAPTSRGRAHCPGQPVPCPVVQTLSLTPIHLTGAKPWCRIFPHVLSSKHFVSQSSKSTQCVFQPLGKIQQSWVLWMHYWLISFFS